MTKKALLKNYLQDLEKSKNRPLLIELAKSDLDTFSDNKNLLLPLVSAKNIYDKNLSNNKTNIINLDGDSSTSSDHFYLLETLIEQLKNEIKDIKSTAMLKEATKMAASMATGGLLSNIFGSQLEKGVDFIINEVGENISDRFIDTASEHIDISRTVLEDIETKVNELGRESLSDFIGEYKQNQLSLSKEAKRELGALLDEFKKADNTKIFLLTFKILLAIAIQFSKIIFINNPHKLDNNSLAIISMILSYAKHMKDSNKHIGFSIVYTYSDEFFQPYREVEEKYQEKKLLLDEQRRFAQRYAMLERPSSDIPKVAVKSSLFVGRIDELKDLKYNFDNREGTTLSIISGDPGIGKTALIKEHLKQVQSTNKKMIQLTLLNEVGHSSSNTGLSSLEKSILEEAERLELIKGWKDKGLDFLKSYTTKDGFVDIVGSILGVDKIIDVGKASYDRFKTDDHLMQMTQSSIGDIDKKEVNEKELQFTKLNAAIQKLQSLSDEALPIILFVDDIQWIDDTASEYILKYMINTFEVYIVASLRPSDAASKLKLIKENASEELYKKSFFKALHVKESEELESMIDVSKIASKTIKLKGFDKKALNELVNYVIQGKQAHLDILTQTIIEEISQKDAKEVNTLFAIETINMLCDEKLYTHHNTERLVLDSPLRINESIEDIKQALSDTFTNVKERYQDSLSHYQNSPENQHFNLMAYAVLEERLHILKLYFGEHGNAAVHTLLFSSLLGAPFSSEIVKNVLEVFSQTDEPLLEPLKTLLSKNKQEINLREEHYEIIDEVYEILRRYISHSSAYNYRHSILYIFLDRQLDYLFKTTFINNQQDAKDKMYGLILEEIEKEEKKQDFYSKHKNSLNAKEYENMLFFGQTKQNVLKKAYHNNKSTWAKDYITSLNNLADFYIYNNQLIKAIKLGTDALDITKDLYFSKPTVWEVIYASILNNLTISYSKNNQLDKSISSGEEALKISKMLYKNDSLRYVENYMSSLINLTTSYYFKGQINDAIRFGEEALSIIKEFYSKKTKLLDIEFMLILKILALSYSSNDQLKEAIDLGKVALDLTREAYFKEPTFYVDEYISSLNNLAILYYKNDQFIEAIDTAKKALDISEKLYKKNQMVWEKAYGTILNTMTISFLKNNQLSEAITLGIKALDISEKSYNKNPASAMGMYSISIDTLITLYSKKDQLDKAIDLGKKALDIAKETYYNDIVIKIKYYQQVIDALSDLYTKNNQLGEAINLRQEALVFMREHYSKNSIEGAKELVSNLKLLAISCIDNDQLSEGVALLKEALNIIREQYFNNKNLWSEDYIRIISSLVQIHSKNDPYAEVIDTRKEALDIARKLYSTNQVLWAEDCIDTLYIIISSYYNNGQLIEAINIGKETLNILSEQYSINPSLWINKYIETATNLIILYKNNNQMDEAIELQKKAMKILDNFKINSSKGKYNE